MLWPLLEVLHGLLGVAVGQRLHEVVVLCRTVRTRHTVAVVAVEVQPLVRRQHQFEAVVALLGKRERKTRKCKLSIVMSILTGCTRFTYLQSFRAAWHRGKDIVGIHGAQNKRRTVPFVYAKSVCKNSGENKIKYNSNSNSM